jgi:hypothetical protein
MYPPSSAGTCTDWAMGKRVSIAGGADDNAFPLRLPLTALCFVKHRNEFAFNWLVDKCH